MYPLPIHPELAFRLDVIVGVEEVGAGAEGVAAPGQPGNIPGESKENCWRREVAAVLESSLCACAAPGRPGSPGSPGMPDFFVMVVGGSGWATLGLSSILGFFGLGLAKS